MSHIPKQSWHFETEKFISKGQFAPVADWLVYYDRHPGKYLSLEQLVIRSTLEVHKTFVEQGVCLKITISQSQVNFEAKHRQSHVKWPEVAPICSDSMLNS